MQCALQNDEDVVVVVGENFEEIVFDESKDVLLEVGCSRQFFLPLSIVFSNND